MAKPKGRKPRETFGHLRVLPSKRVQASYVGADGHRYTAPRTFDTLTDARAWLAGRRVELARGTWVSPNAAAAAKAAAQGTLGEYAEQWIGTRTGPSGAPLRHRTREEYERLLRTSLAPLLGEHVGALTTAHVRAWYSALVSSGRATLAARSYGLLRSIYGTAVQDGLVTQNPVQIRGAQNASTGRKVTPPTAAELSVLVNHMPDRLKAAVLIAAWAGVRYGELTELRRKDLTLVELAGDGVWIVNVSRAVVHTSSGFVVGKTKSEAGVRQIALPPHVTAAVARHLAEHVPEASDALLFPAADGLSHLGQSTLVKHWYPARKAAGREDLPWHGLRHFGATRAALAGATLKELQERMGHSTTAAAMRYQHTAGRDLELAKRMSALEDLPIG